VAEFLSAHPQVESVAFAGLPDSRIARRGPRPYGRDRGFDTEPAFVIAGGRKARQRFVQALELHSHVANIGDVRSLAIRPATTTHSPLGDEEQLATGVNPGLVRLSVGVEAIDNILANIEQGFRAAKV
jgi:O-acetylhomoserine (thiol)-lyase